MKTRNMVGFRDVEAIAAVDTNGVQRLTLHLFSERAAQELHAALHRALNTWPQRPSWLEELSDLLESREGAPDHLPKTVTAPPAASGSGKVGEGGTGEENKNG